ncbi:hypothetical protein EVAR_25205_1 [Eumeta japonica]|uniref:PH domain-containing protein n=1 Tax=Eumeta variegata TaxID=151549 RepID=A0A4C1WGJ1_EUMVA|nr:hypothetical protein EVAR_25205_1 [Eumeta japonica]
MSGYLELKYPFKSNLPLNPFKSWKRQWCILRPCPHRPGAGALAVYSSEAGAAAESVDLPPGCVVRRAHSRTRPYAFAVFGPDNPRKPRLLLAAHTLHDTQLWMDKIRTLLNENILFGGNIILKDSFSVSIMSTEFSYKLGLIDAGAVLCVSSKGVSVTQPSMNADVLIPWLEILNVTLKGDTISDKHRVCVIMINSSEEGECPELVVRGSSVAEVVRVLRRALADSRVAFSRIQPSAVEHVREARGTLLSRSYGDLSEAEKQYTMGVRRRRSWNDGPSQVSLDDTDLVMSKECASFPLGQLSRCAGAVLAPAAAPLGPPAARLFRGCHSADSLNGSMCERRSLVSLSSGVYEEILDSPATPGAPTPLPCEGASTERARDEPTYESVVECAFATLRPHRKPAPAHGPPPPLPPRQPYRREPHSTGVVVGRRRRRTSFTQTVSEISVTTFELVKPVIGSGQGWSFIMKGQPNSLKASESWRGICGGGGESGNEVTRHSSLNSLPRSCSAGAAATGARTLPKPDKAKPFNMFRKRLKSDSRVPSTTAKSEHAPRDHRAPVETKKKRFDFTPSRDIFKNFRVSRGLMKNLKISSSNLAKIGETKSCEFLDESEHAAAAATGRCAKSVECLDAAAGRPLESPPPVDPVRGPDESDDRQHSDISLPDDIMELILRGRDVVAQLRLRQHRLPEDEYVPVSPAGLAPAPDHHYVAMSPRTDLAAP